MSVFLSYASIDRPLAEKLRADLLRYVDVFLDAKSIPGGAEWEREIDGAIRRCKVFAPIVSQASNNSKWVTKETLLAISVGVPILPLLCSDSLPLRIVDRQFVDFRDSFEAGLSDLLVALGNHLGPFRPSREVIDSLIAKAIRARLGGDIREANALVEQFVGIDSEIAVNADSFWRKLETTLKTDLAKSVPPRLTIRETTSRMGRGHYGDRDAYKWVLELHGANDCLYSINAVVYTLHPTFPDPIRKVRSREDHFRLEGVGWGTFNVRFRVEFVDYTAFDGAYRLTFLETHEAPLLGS